MKTVTGNMSLSYTSVNRRLAVVGRPQTGSLTQIIRDVVAGSGGNRGITAEYNPTTSKIDFVAAVGGGLPDSFKVLASRNSVITLTTPSTTTDWGPWTTLASTAGMGSDQQGGVIVLGHIEVEATNALGSDTKFNIEARIQRTRQSGSPPADVATTLSEAFLFAEAGPGTQLKLAERSIIADDEAEENDRYSIDIRVRATRASIALTLSTTDNGLSILSRSGIKGDRGPQGAPGGFDSSLVDARIADWAKVVFPSGEAPPERLGTGIRTGSKFLRDDGVWSNPPAPPAVSAADELNTRATAPAITGFELGDIINVNGCLLYTSPSPRD